MRQRKSFPVASFLAVLGLLLASCAPAAAPTPPPKAVAPPTAPATAAAAAKAPTPAPGAPTPSPKPAADQPRYGGILNITHFANPASLDPIQETSQSSVGLSVPSYSGIVQHDPLKPTEVIGDLAEKWDVTSDARTYTFNLYKNVKWHDGTPFTALDVPFALDLVRNPPKGFTSPRTEWLKAVDRIEAPDKDTVKITLKYPSASFLHNLADGRMVIVPKHVVEAKGNMKKDVVGTGPYKFKSFEAGSVYSVVKNADYFIKGRPYLDGITWYIIPDSSTRFAAFRTHRVNATCITTSGLTPTQSDLARKEMGDKVTIDRYSALNGLPLWMLQTKPPYNDVRVRKAVDLTIDREKVVATSPIAAVVGGFMPAGGQWSLPEAELMNMPGYRKSKDADLAEAKRLLAEAGYPQGFKTTILCRNVAQGESGSLTVKEQLAQIGIEATVNSKDATAMYDLLYRDAFDLCVFAATYSYDDPDQIFGQNFVTGVANNYSHFSDPQIDKMNDEQARAMDSAKRKQIVLDMQRRLHELVPVSVLSWVICELGRWNEVRGYKAGVGYFNNLKFQDVWLAN